MPVSLVCSCEKCGHKDYRLNNTQNFLEILRNSSEKGIFTCYHCHKNNMIVKQLKWKDTKQLIKKFPNKKAIFTTLSVEELLKLDDDFSSKPNVNTEE